MSLAHSNILVAGLAHWCCYLPVWLPVRPPIDLSIICFSVAFQKRLFVQWPLSLSVVTAAAASSSDRGSNTSQYSPTDSDVVQCGANDYFVVIACAIVVAVDVGITSSCLLENLCDLGSRLAAPVCGPLACPLLVAVAFVAPLLLTLTTTINNDGCCCCCRRRHKCRPASCPYWPHCGCICHNR